MPLKDLDGKVVNTIWAAKKLLIRNRIFIRWFCWLDWPPEPVPPLIEPAFSFSSLRRREPNLYDPVFVRGPVTEEFARSKSNSDEKGGPAMNTVGGL